MFLLMWDDFQKPLYSAGSFKDDTDAYNCGGV